MNTVALLATLRDRGIELTVQADQIRYRSTHGALTEDLRTLISTRRDEIIAALSGQTAQAVNGRAMPPRDPEFLSHLLLQMLPKLPKPTISRIAARSRLAEAVISIARRFEVDAVSCGRISDDTAERRRDARVVELDRYPSMRTDESVAKERRP